MIRLAAVLSLGLATASAGWADTDMPSVEVSDCDWQASARNIVEPWEDNSRTFSNGKTRIAFLDTIEPAAGWAYLLVLSPPFAELGDRQCKVIGTNGMGFSGMRFDELTASYDPATGLTFAVPVQIYQLGHEQLVWTTLSFTLNQATGEIRGELLL
ncbi:hypothetical protein [Pseudoponticoccus marisrubri]|uniref:Uncharacterized protein n=1 Tax=Pseudoponticoccus marisrubri TaxID=1685382 RepID=A0A0W7WK87_9RHOB|nr:hypothetical protein [Pseudoponticoccus marisrubri]KUF11024.1 hypothetical protein AVJ23_08175 [Pseudoponticoccus marisrubri]